MVIWLSVNLQFGFCFCVDIFLFRSVVVWIFSDDACARAVKSTLLILDMHSAVFSFIYVLICVSVFFFSFCLKSQNMSSIDLIKELSTECVHFVHSSKSVCQLCERFRLIDSA